MSDNLKVISELSAEKTQLELQKLKIDIVYAKRSFVIQVVNTATIAVAAIAALYFFQRPQIDQMEMARVATEKQQTANLVLSALSLENEQDRAAMLKTLAQMYPEFEYIGSISKSNLLVNEKSNPSAGNPPAESKTTQPQSPSCGSFKARWRALKESHLDLINRAYAEEQGVRGDGRSGKQGQGRAWQSIMMQLSKSEAEIAALELQMREAQCPK